MGQCISCCKAKRFSRRNKHDSHYKMKKKYIKRTSTKKSNSIHLVNKHFSNELIYYNELCESISNRKRKNKFVNIVKSTYANE